MSKKEKVVAVIKSAKSVKVLPTVSDAAVELPFEVEELNRELVAFLATPFDVPGTKSSRGSVH
jgi:hypothetical protein